MKNFSRFPLALGGLYFFLASSIAAPHHHVGLVKRDVPDFIQSWPLYQDYQTMREGEGGAELDVPILDSVTLADYDKGSKTLTWGCNRLVLGEQIAVNVAAIHKATLKPYPEPTVIAKRSYGERYAVIYGGILQKKCSSNPNVLPVIDYVYQEDPRRPYGWLILPYVSEGSLETNFGSYSDQNSVNAAFKQMLNAVAGVQSEGIIHRDLKPENFLKDGDTLKLMDFDQSRETSSSEQYDVGTESYLAPAVPEILAMKSDTGAAYDYRVDTFSMAMTFMVMSVAELQGSTERYRLWKDVIQPNGKLWPSADVVADVLKARNYAVFSNNDNLLNVIAKALCAPSERYYPQGFQSAFAGVV
ncbi:kinase-like domain-containing protein [Penicillium lagena]|uniref:kinase-like domain-containing protein n=1 Tax=Penicillium lagena TaxID=94218 RepID=UPI002541B5EE|nr:kinase-like domain-containing protein [Penicillium lagena]KAJ5606039.1 kinase-like domain-containing protein [Penicillium lagena]